MSKLKEYINEYLKNHNMLQKDFADIIGVQPNTLSQWINGKRQPDYDSLIIMSRVLKIPIDTLLGADTIESRKPTEYEIQVALFGGAEHVSEENWKKVKEFAEFLKTYKMDENKGDNK